MTYELYHHGILGQKWGVRRFQNEDGSLTNAGRSRYDVAGPRTNDQYLNSTGVSSGGKYASQRQKDARRTNPNSSRTKRLEKMDDRLQNYVQGQSTAKKLAKSYLLGTSGIDKTYDLARSTGRGRINSLLISSFDINASSYVAAGAGAAGAAFARKCGLDAATAGAVGLGTGLVASRAFASTGADYSLQQRRLQNRAISGRDRV